MLLGERHADGVREALAERPGGRLDAEVPIDLRVPGGVRAELPEVLQVVDAERVTGQVQQRIEQHRAVAVRQHEAVAVGPVGMARVVLEVVAPEHLRDVGHAHRHARVPGIGLLDRIHAQRTDRVGELPAGGHRLTSWKARYFRGPGGPESPYLPALRASGHEVKAKRHRSPRPGWLYFRGSNAQRNAIDVNQLPVHVRVRLRRPSGQGRRPDLRRRARRDARAGQARARRLRDAGQDRRRHRRRRSDDRGLGRPRGTGARRHHRHRLHLVARRLRRAHLRRAQHHRQAVARHRDGRRPRQAGGTGRGRPGPDVRLREQRDRIADAGADLLRAPARRAPGGGAQERPAAVAAAGCEVAGDLPLRERQGHRARRRRALDAARPGRQAGGPARSRDGAHHQARAAEGVAAARTPSSTSTRPATS